MSFSYPDGTTALHAIRLTVATGEVIGLLGPNGCGKTTLLRTIARASRRATAGLQVRDPGTVALALDRPVFRGWLSGRQNAVTCLRLRGMGRAAAEDVANTWFERFGLDAVADRPVSTYSRGIAHRLGLAVAFATKAGLVLLDEPLAGLDPAARDQVADVLCACVGAGTTVVLSTHDPNFAAANCDRVAFLADGRLLAVETPSSFIASVGGETRIDIRFGQTEAPFERLPPPPTGIHERARTPGGISLGVEDPPRALPLALTWLSGAGVRVSSVDVREPGLREAYFKVTGQRLEPERTE